MTVHEVLEKALVDFNQVNEDIKRLLTSGADLLWKPTADKWNAAQCIEHLIVTNGRYFPALDKRLTVLKGKENNQQLYKPTFWGKMIYCTVDPTTIGKKKTKTPKIFKPQPDIDIKTLLQRWNESQQQLLSYLQKTMETDANKKIASPVSPLVLLSLADVMVILSAHEVRHYLQAVNVVAMRI